MQEQVINSPNSKLERMERPLIDDALIAEITQKIVEAFHPRRVILFGSRARGDYHADSDIDVFIEMESDEKRWQRRIRVDSIFRERWWPMDLVDYTPEEVETGKNSFASIVPRMLREGRELYRADDRSAIRERVLHITT